MVDGQESLCVFMVDASVPARVAGPGANSRTRPRTRTRYLFDESWMLEFLLDTRTYPDIS